MTNESQSHLGSLSEDQVNELVRFIIDGYGVGLSWEELDESIGVVMENIPGLELESTQKIDNLVQQIRSQYNDQTQPVRNKDRDQAFEPE